MLQNVDFLKFLIYTLFEVGIMDNIFLNNCFKIISYKKNEMIVNEGDICVNIGFLLEGSLSVSNTLPDFNESIIQVLNKGDVFGENLIFSDNPYYPGNIYANNNCQIAFISKNNFLNKFFIFFSSLFFYNLVVIKNTLILYTLKTQNTTQ